MIKKTWIVAAPLADKALVGRAKVVKEGTKKRYIYEDEPVEILKNGWFYRRLARKEVIEVDRKKFKPTPAVAAGAKLAKTKKVASKQNPLDNREVEKPTDAKGK